MASAEIFEQVQSEQTFAISVDVQAFSGRIECGALAWSHEDSLPASGRIELQPNRHRLAVGHIGLKNVSSWSRGNLRRLPIGAPYLHQRSDVLNVRGGKRSGGGDARKQGRRRNGRQRVWRWRH